MCDIEITSAMDTGARAGPGRDAGAENRAHGFVVRGAPALDAGARAEVRVVHGDGRRALRDVECAKAACRDADALLAWLASDEALRAKILNDYGVARFLDNCRAL